MGAGGAAALGAGGEAASGGPEKLMTAGAGGVERSPSGVGEGGAAAPAVHNVRDQPFRAMSRLQREGCTKDSRRCAAPVTERERSAKLEADALCHGKLKA